MRKNDNLTTKISGAESLSIFAVVKTFTLLGFISIYVCGFEFFKAIKGSFKADS